MWLISFGLLVIVTLTEALAHPDGFGIGTSSVLDAAGNVASGMVETGLKGAETVKNGMETGAKDATGAAQFGVGAAKDAANTITSAMKADIQSGLNNGLIKNVEDMKTVISNCAKSMAGITAHLSNVPGMAVQVAGNLWNTMGEKISMFMSKEELTKFVTQVMTAGVSSTGTKL